MLRTSHTTCKAESLAAKWEALCNRYLPISDEQSLWRYSRLASISEPAQGWKLHLAATVLTATDVLERLGPFLQAKGVLFKAPRNLQDLNRINSGLFYGYTQVGKAFTVYPPTDRDCVALANELHELTLGFAAPSVPFDERYRPGSLVFYRYGSFKRQSIQNTDGTETLVISAPNGNLIPDSRESVGPEWASNPFPPEIQAEPEPENPLARKFRVLKALTQRGKGGVYQAVDFSGPSPRLCVLKEGRRHGEVTFDGRDGYWRVKREKRVLAALRRRGIPVPRIFSSFNLDGNFYLVTEYIEGTTLQKLLSTRKRRLPITRVLQLGIQVARIVSLLHSAGWVWRDCKPANLILEAADTLRLIDFEGACKIGDRTPLDWGTEFFLPLDFNNEEYQSDPTIDLYSLGVVIYYLLTGKFPAKENPVPVEKLRRNTPQPIRHVVAELMSPRMSERPSAQAVAERLNNILRDQVDLPRQDRKARI
jgi:tRNA A-37 threonylcarbamoyl transferase component Bud32